MVFSKLQIGQWLITLAVIGLPSYKIRNCNILSRGRDTYTATKARRATQVYCSNLNFQICVQPKATQTVLTFSRIFRMEKRPAGLL